MSRDDALGSGLVEGFYGRPWTWQERVRAVRFLGSVGLGAYLYAPKNDPAHRSRWWEPLAPAELLEIRRLAEAGAEVGVRVVYGVSPERTLGPRTSGRRSEARGLAALVDRFAALLDQGLTSFALLFDDTLATFVPGLIGESKGREHGLLGAGVLAELERRSTSPSLVVVPAVYHRRASEMSRGARAYLAGLGALGHGLPIAWTGPRIFSRWISERDVVDQRTATGQPVWIWNNAFANDWLPLATGESLGLAFSSRLAFGPVQNLAASALTAANGVLLNGSREPSLALVSVATLAELAREGAEYDPDAALDRAFIAVVGEGARAMMGELHDLVRGHPIAAPHLREGARVRDLVREQRLRAPSPAARTELERELEGLITLEARLVAELEDHPVLTEIRPTAMKAALVARAVRAAVLGDAASARDLVKRARAVRWATGIDGLMG